MSEKAKVNMLRVLSGSDQLLQVRWLRQYHC